MFLIKIYHILFAWIDRLYIILKLANEQYEIHSRECSDAYRPYQILRNIIEKLKARGGNADIIRELEYIMPDEFVKLVYTKQIYNEEEKERKEKCQ